VNSQAAAKRTRPAERFSGRSHAEYRRLFNKILSSSGEGRITLAVLKDISRMLQRFYGARLVEIVYRENHKLLHAKTARESRRSHRGGGISPYAIRIASM